MFEVRCIVGDKKLSDVLRALHDHTIEPPVVIPVDEDHPDAASAPKDEAKEQYKPKKKKSRAGGKRIKGDGASQVVRDLIAGSGVTRISAKEMRRATIAQGYSPGAYSHAVKLLLADKTIKKLSTFGDYAVVGVPAEVSDQPTTQANEMIQNG